MPTSITGPDNAEYEFPDGTTKEQAISYFKAKGIGSAPSTPAMQPPKFAPKVPDPISGLRGEEDMSGITVASPGTFSDRVGDRIKQNIDAVPQSLDSLKRQVQGKPATEQDTAQSTYFDKLVGGPDYRKGTVTGAVTGAAKSAMLVPHMVYDMGKSWTQDPANAVGDIVAGYVMHQASSGGQSEQAVPRKMQVPEKVPLTEEQQAAYTKSLDKANAQHTEALAEYAEKEADARAKWVQKAFKAKQSAVESVKAVNKKEILNRGVEEYTKVVQDNLQKTHNAVRGQLDSRWNSLRDAMQDATVPSSDIFNAVESAKNEFLRGSPASTAQFNNLIKEIGVEKFTEDEAGNLTATQDNAPVPWDTARVHSSAIGNALSSGNLPGNVYQALKAVRTAIEDHLGKAAETAGRGDEYNSVRKDWSNYMTDWKDVSGVNKGGSPLAHAIASPDAPTVTKIINGPAGDRMIGTLAKYKRFGGRPDLLAATRSTSAAADAIKVPTTKAMPAPYDAARPPELAEVPPPGAIPKKLGPIAKGALHLVGGIAGAKVMSPTGHTFVGYMAGSKAATALGESMLEGTEAVPPAFRKPGLVSRGKSAISPATGLPAASAVVGARALRGEDADSKAVNQANEDIQAFIDSLPQ
jgi:hypothetical protein